MSKTPEKFWLQLKDRLERTTDKEEQINLLRTFPREKRKEIESRDLKEISLPDLWLELTALAESVLQGGLWISWQSSKGNGPRGNFAIVGMGKLGGRELTYRSDLDIIYLYEDPADQEFYTRLGTRMISAISVLTNQGYAYQIDASLRPSGNAGMLVSSLQSFQEYHRDLGRTWERQSLIKARPLMGRPDRSSEFLTTLHTAFEKIAYQDYDPILVASEIRHLRERMEREINRETPGHYHLKTGRGGLVDIEFTIQYLQLIHGKTRPKVRNPNTILALEALQSEKLISPPLAERLHKAYLFYRDLETRIRFLLDNPTDELIEGSDPLKAVEKRFFEGKSIIPQYLEVREEVRKIYERILNP